MDRCPREVRVTGFLVASVMSVDRTWPAGRRARPWQRRSSPCGHHDKCGSPASTGLAVGTPEEDHLRHRLGPQRPVVGHDLLHGLSALWAERVEPLAHRRGDRVGLALVLVVSSLLELGLEAQQIAGESWSVPPSGGGGSASRKPSLTSRRSRRSSAVSVMLMSLLDGGQLALRPSQLGLDGFFVWGADLSPEVPLQRLDVGRGLLLGSGGSRTADVAHLEQALVIALGLVIGRRGR